MKTKSRARNELCGSRRGAVAIVVALLLAGLCGFAAIAIDLGHARHVKGQLQNVADAAALSGTMQFDMFGAGLAVGRSEAVRIAAQNVANGTPVNDVNPNWGNNPTGDVVLGRWDFVRRTWSPRAVPWRTTGMIVRARRAGPTAVDTWFAQTLGVGTVDIRAEALAARGGPPCVSGFPVLLKDCAIVDPQGHLDCSGTLRELAPNAYRHGGVTDLGDASASVASIRGVITTYSRTAACSVNAGQDIRLYDELMSLLPDIDAMIDPDGDGVPTPAIVEVPVVEAPQGCGLTNRNSYRVSGFADIELLSVTQLPHTGWVRFRVVCGRKVPERSMSNYFGIGARSVLVK